MILPCCKVVARHLSEDRHGGNVGDGGCIVVGWLVGCGTLQHSGLQVVGGRKAGGLQVVQAVVAIARQAVGRVRPAPTHPQLGIAFLAKCARKPHAAR